MAQIELTTAYLQKTLQTPPIQGFWLVTNAAGVSSLVSLSQIDKSHIGLGNVGNVKNQYVGTRAPLSSDDLNSGYSIGSVWIFGALAWLCVANGANAAAWTPLTGGGGGGTAGSFDGGAAAGSSTGGLDGGGA